MSVDLILNLLNELNKSILCEPLAIIILFYLMSSKNLEINLYELNILFIIYSQKELLIVKSDHFSRHAYNVTLTFSALLTLYLYGANDVTSKYYYSSVVSFLLNGFISLLHRVLCDKMCFIIVRNNSSCSYFTIF